ncbi:unnamed protein product [Pedinophyceae sp. YPF-701]|nr:unnamed protein product [Pedinophyceae sp. YPF-701]
MDRILRASYGDRNQRDENRRRHVPDSAAALAAIERVKERKAALAGNAFPEPPPVNPVYRPPFWNSKVYGPPKGDWDRKHEVRVAYERPFPPEAPSGEIRAPRKAFVGPPRVAAGGAVPGLDPPKPRHAERQGAPPHAPPEPARGAARRGPHHAHGAAPAPPPYVKDLRKLQAAVAPLEEKMRKQVKARTGIHQRPEDILVRAFCKATGREGVSAGDPRFRVTTAEFRRAWRYLGVEVTEDAAAAMFNHHGQDPSGRMPVAVFSDALLVGAARLLGRLDSVMPGPYRRGGDLSHRGAIKYPQCRKPVFPPTTWDPKDAEPSLRAPDVRLELEWVHGYEGKRNTCPNVFYLASGEVAFNAAALGVVYDPRSHTQRFFTGHDDDVTSIAVHPDGATVATGQVGAEPVVKVWDSKTMRELATLKHAYGNRGITSLAFSPDGELLATVSTDNPHTLGIWDWRRGKLLTERKTAPGAPPSTYGVVWCPAEGVSRPGPVARKAAAAGLMEHTPPAYRLATYGVNSLKIFELSRQGAGKNAPLDFTRGEAGVFGKVKTHTITAAAFLRTGELVTGNGNGRICTWRGANCVAAAPAHDIGPETHRPDGKLARFGVRALVVRRDGTLLSGGADGVVRAWDVSTGALGKCLWKLPLLPDAQQTGAVPSPIRALDASPDGSHTFVAGTWRCEVWEVDKDPEVLVMGHQADLYGVATHPTDPRVFATFQESDRVLVWDAEGRRVARAFAMGQGNRTRSGAFSPDGRLLAVGLKNGGVKVLTVAGRRAEQVFWAKTFESAVDVLAWSPDGTLLAAGSHDQAIDVFRLAEVAPGAWEGKRTVRCVGHSSTITHMDFSVDGTLLMSNDQAYELLYFDVRTGRQVATNQRDTAWRTYTGVLGFPVMGIWPPDSDGTDINALDRAPSGRFLATSDDSGFVKLFNWPAVYKRAEHEAYAGHASHVMDVRWACDESRVFSAGGKDLCAMQWRVMPRKPAVAQYQVRAPWGDR